MVWENGQLSVEEGVGQYVPRPTFPVLFEAVQRRNELRRPVAVRRQPSHEVTP